MSRSTPWPRCFPTRPGPAWSTSPCKPDDRERITWERTGLLATATAGRHIAATSQHIRHHLTSAYALPSSAITDLTNHEQQPSQPADTSLPPPPPRPDSCCPSAAPKDSRGFDDLLDALHILTTSHTPLPHTVLAADTDTPTPTSYQRTSPTGSSPNTSTSPCAPPTIPASAACSALRPHRRDHSLPR